MSLTSHPQPPVPRAIVVSGPAGVGKTTLGRALAARLQYAIVDLDTVTGPLARLALEQLGATSQSFDSPAGRRIRALRYDALLDVAQANLELGLGVVLTAPFTRESHDASAWNGLRRRFTSLALIYLDAPAEVLLQRLRERNEPRDHDKFGRGPLAAASGGAVVEDAIRLDATFPVEAQVDAALRALAQRTSPSSLVASGQ